MTRRALVRLAECHSIFDLRARARRRLPHAIFDVMDGAAESEITARRNLAAFDDIGLVPQCLVNVEHVDLTTRIFGQSVKWPVFFSPTGGTRLCHPEGELVVARAAAKTGTLYGLSTASTQSIEAVARASDGPKLFQLYICRDRDFTRTLIDRAKSAGYGALCVTVDTPVTGKWERELRSRISDPWYRWPVRTLAGMLRHPAWALHRLPPRGAITLANFGGPDGAPAAPDVFAEQLDPSITWKDIRQVADWWRGPLAIKGVMSADDARRAADVGATAIIVSNHGGRQLDGSIASVEALPHIARAVGDRLEIILDGGVRRGVHVLKALALGAKACSIGRPYLYGLIAGGEAGVVKAAEILRTELTRAMQLAGCPNLGSISGKLVCRVAIGS